MKNTTKVTVAAGFAALFTLATNVNAGIAASPKVQQMLNEKAARTAVSAPVSSATYRTPGLKDIAASPKVSQMLAERNVVVSGAPATQLVSSGYNPTGADGVAASPKLRSQLNERNAPIIIAPLK